MSDLLKAFQTAEANRRNGNITHYSLSYKSFKSDSESIVIRSKSWKYGYWFKTILGSRLWGYEKLPKELTMDSRMVRKGSKYYLCHVIPIETRTGPKPGTVVSIDPGMRTFMTCYDPVNHQIQELSKGTDSTRIFHSLKHADKLEKEIRSTSNKRKRVRMKKALKRMRQRLINRIKDMHRKTAA